MKRFFLIICSILVLSTSYGIGQTHNETTSEDTIKSFLTRMYDDKLYEDYDFLQKHCSPELLKKLQDKNIPVIFRPLHEASGNTYGQYAGGGAWFWWGIEGAETYKKLWIYIYEYFHNAGINNLIWVWTSQNNGDTDWYPGDAYVDIIGQDIYSKSADDNAKDFAKLQKTYPNKMVTLSECGNVGKITDQWSKGARWAWFMPWYKYDASTLDNHDHADTSWWKDAMSHRNVITRDQMPSLK